MSKNTTQSGNRQERKVVRFLKDHGYTCRKSRMSKDPFDREAHRTTKLYGREVRYIQVKENGWASGKEMAQMASYPLPEHQGALVTREVWRVDTQTSGFKVRRDPREYLRARLVEVIITDKLFHHDPIPLLPEDDK